MLLPDASILVPAAQPDLTSTPSPHTLQPVTMADSKYDNHPGEDEEDEEEIDDSVRSSTEHLE